MKLPWFHKIDNGTQKTIAIFCRSLDKRGKLFGDPYYWDAYSDLLLLLQELGARAYLVTDHDSYQGNGVFTPAYTLKAKGAVDDLIRVDAIKADLVFDRGGFKGRDVAVLNPDFVSGAGADKIKTYELFAKYQPFSIPCNSQEELLQAMNEIPGNNIVVKTPRGGGGRGVYVGSKADALTNVPGTYPLLVQEFLDTSRGIPGYVTGIHDFRVEIGGGEIWGCYIRMPKLGEHKANIAQGGSKIILSHTDVPAEVVTLVHEIDDYFKEYPRFYGLDFAHTNQGWKLIEINSSQLGLVAISGGPGSSYTLHKLAQYLIDCSQ